MVTGERVQEAPGGATFSPSTLLEVAERRLCEATLAERQTRRAMEDRPPRATWDDVAQVQHRTRQAQDQVEKLTRSRDLLRARLPEAQQDLRFAEGALAQVEEQARKSLIRARRQVALAREEVERTVADLVALAGRESVPRD